MPTARGGVGAPSRESGPGPSSRVIHWGIGGLVGVAAIASVIVWRGRSPSTRADPAPPPIAADRSEAPPATHSLIHSESDPGQPLFGAWVRPRTDRPAILLIRSASLPANGGLVVPTATDSVTKPNQPAEATPTLVPAERITLHPASIGAGVVGLSWPGQPSIDALVCGPWTTTAEPRAISPSAPTKQTAVRWTRATTDPSTVSVQPTQLASTLIVHDQRAIGFALGGDRAVTIGAFATSDRAPVTLAQWQDETKPTERSPLQRLAAALADDANRTDEAKLRELARQATELARRPGAKPSEIDAANRLRRSAWRQLVRTVRERDEDAARKLALDFHERDPNDLGLLDDALSLALGGGDPSTALALFERLRPLDHERATALADALIAQHANLSDPTTLERLSQAVPDAPAVDRLLARAYRAAGRHGEALTHAQRAARDPALGIDLGAYREAARAASRPTPGTVRIPYDPNTRAIRTTARVGGHSLRLLVDTGATYSSVPSSLARSLRLATIRKVTVHTASGTIQADLVALPAIELGGFQLTGVRALVLDLPGDSNTAGRGLLGMNVLRRFQVKMDPDAGIMQLTPRRSNRANRRRRR